MDLDAVQDAMQSRLVQLASQPCVGAVGFDAEILECSAAGRAEPAADDDPVSVRSHAAPSGWPSSAPGLGETIHSVYCLSICLRVAKMIISGDGVDHCARTRFT